MWAQLMVMRLKPGREDDLSRLYEQLHATEQPGSGLLRTIGALDQKDPGRVYNLVLFESKDHAGAGAGPTTPGGTRRHPGSHGGGLRRPARVHRPAGRQRPDLLTSHAGEAVAPAADRQDGGAVRHRDHGHAEGRTPPACRPSRTLDGSLAGGRTVAEALTGTAGARPPCPRPLRCHERPSGPATVGAGGRP